jgi:hypothetical protein
MGITFRNSGRNVSSQIVTILIGQKYRDKMSQPWAGRNYSRLKCHTVQTVHFSGVDKHSVHLRWESHSSKLSQGGSKYLSSKLPHVRRVAVAIVTEDEQFCGRIVWVGM